MRGLKLTIYSYISLIFLEGILRKWVVPDWSFLLIVRDPLVILIYLVALKNNKFPINVFIVVNFFLMGIFMLIDVFSPYKNIIIAFYGLRTYFLHIPLIFLIPEVLNTSELRKIGKLFLYLSIPMAIILAIQFLSPPESVWNRPVKGGIIMFSANYHVRPYGIFPYVSGVALYLAFTTAFIFYGFLNNVYSRLLLIISIIAVIFSLSVSGSRLVIFSVAIVFLCGLIYLIMVYPKVPIKLLGCVVLSLFIVLSLPIFKKGISTTTERFILANIHERKIVNRIKKMFLPSFPKDNFWYGEGIGIGTNVGAVLIKGDPDFLLGENMWVRVIKETGVFWGVSYIFYIISILIFLSIQTIKALWERNPLPLLFWAVCSHLLLRLVLNPPTTLGFIVCAAGFLLIATRN